MCGDDSEGIGGQPVADGIRQCRAAVYIDTDAAGHGWYVDATPDDDAEVAASADGSTWIATADSVAATTVDLLSVILHELGHVVGNEHSTDGLLPTLATGVRVVPSQPLLSADDEEDATTTTAAIPAIDWEPYLNHKRVLPARGADWVKAFVNDLAHDATEDPNAQIRVELTEREAGEREEE